MSCVSPEIAEPSLRVATWKRLCDRPLLYHCADFLTSAECDAVIRSALAVAPRSLSNPGASKLRVDLHADDKALANEDAHVLQNIERRVESLTGLPMHDGELPWQVHFTPPGVSDEHADVVENRMTLGLHVDTNNCRDRRWVTFIIYLHSTPASSGGHTVFPLAVQRNRSKPQGRTSIRRMMEAARILLANNVQHTGASGCSVLCSLPSDVRNAAELLLERAGQIANSAAEAGNVATSAGVAVRGNAEDGSKIESHVKARSTASMASKSPSRNFRASKVAPRQPAIKHSDKPCMDNSTKSLPLDNFESAFLDPNGIGVAVGAWRGSCVAFYTRSSVSHGAIDPCSWHGGAAVRNITSDEGAFDADAIAYRAGKWTLQKFREVPAQLPADDEAQLLTCCGVEEFAQQHSVLNPISCEGVRFEVTDG